jgi:hypothetical protein
MLFRIKYLSFVFQLSFPAMLKKKRPQEYKLRAFVGILFLSIVFLVGFAYVFYHQQVLQVISYVYCYDGVTLCLCWTSAANRPIVLPPDECRWKWSIAGMILTGENQMTQRETCPSDTLSTTNFIWTALGVNPGLCDEKLAINCLCYAQPWYVYA